MKFSEMFKNYYSTKDDSEYNELKSHYYKTKLEDAKAVVRNLILSEKGIITDENEKYGEINFETKDYMCTVCVLEITPIEIAIDFHIRTFGLIPRGKGLKLITSFYKYLDSHLPFKGLGLYHDRYK